MNSVLKVLLRQHKSVGQIKTTPKLGFFFFKVFLKNFKELRITAFELSGFRSHASGGN